MPTMMQWTGGTMYTQRHMSGQLRPPPPLIDMRQFNLPQPSKDCMIPPVSYMVPPASCSVRPMKCMVPSVNSTVPPVNYSTTAKCMVPPVNCSVPPTNCTVPPVNCSVPPTNCTVPPVNCSVPPTNCTLQPMNCSVPPANCMVTPMYSKATAIPYRASNSTMQHDYTGRSYMCDYWPSPTYPQWQAPQGATHPPFSMGHAPTDTLFATSYNSFPHSNGVVGPAQEHRSSMRHAPYAADKCAPSWAMFQPYGVGVKNPYQLAAGWAPQGESRRRLAEKIWRRRAEAQSYLNYLNIGSRTSPLITQQILNDELTLRCRNGSVDRTAGCTTSPCYTSTPLPMMSCTQVNAGPDAMTVSRMSPSASPPVPMKACPRVNAGQDVYSHLYVNTSPSMPVMTDMQQKSKNVYSPRCETISPPSCGQTTGMHQNLRKNAYSPLCENISPPLSCQWENVWSPTSMPPAREMLPITNRGQFAPLSTTGAQLPCGTSSTTSCAQLPRVTSSTSSCVPRCCVTSREVMEFSDMETIDAIFFRRYPCNLFKKALKCEDSSPSTVAHLHTCKSESSSTTPQPACEPVSSSSDLSVCASVPIDERECVNTPVDMRIGTCADLSTVISNEQWLDTLTDLGGGNLVATEQRECVSVPVDHRDRSPERLGDTDSSTQCQTDASSSLDTSVDSCEDRLYIHIPVEEDTC